MFFAKGQSDWKSPYYTAHGTSLLSDLHFGTKASFEPWGIPLSWHPETCCSTQIKYYHLEYLSFLIPVQSLTS